MLAAVADPLKDIVLFINEAQTSFYHTKVHKIKMHRTGHFVDDLDDTS